MRRSLAIILIVMSLCSLLTGCWSKRELNELSIASAIGIDKDGDKYIVTVQIINPSEVSSQKATGQRVASFIYTTEGKTIFEALRRMTTMSTRRIYLAHIRAVVFGEDLARQGLKDLLDFLFRDHEMRSNIHLLVAKNTKAEYILSMLTGLDKIPANKMYISLERTEEFWATAHAAKLDDFVNSLSSEGKNPVVSGIIIQGNIEIGSNKKNLENARIPAILRIDNIAAFHRDKLIGWLNEKEGMGYNQIVGKMKSTLITIKCPKGNDLGIEIMKTKCKAKGVIENGKPKIYINFQAEGNVGDVQCDIDLTKVENVNELERILEKTLEKNMEAVIKKAQNELRTDIFGFGEVIHRSYPKQWKTMKKDWSNQFIDLPVSINTTAKIRGLGTITNPINNEIIKE